MQLRLACEHADDLPYMQRVKASMLCAELPFGRTHAHSPSTAIPNDELGIASIGLNDELYLMIGGKVAKIVKVEGG